MAVIDRQRASRRIDRPRPFRAESRGTAVFRRMFDADLRQHSERVGIIRPALDELFHQADRARTVVGGIRIADREDQDRKSNTSELQSLMRISYAVFCLKKKKNT